MKTKPTQELQVANPQPMAVDASIMTSLVINGDLSKLSADQKVKYYVAFCQRLGVDPATQPFKIIRLQGKEVLYCDRGGAAQLSKLHNVSRKILSRETSDDVHCVTVQVSTPDGRTEESIGAVSVHGLKGEALCNAKMKAETKAKRRATLDLIGLGMLDESEVTAEPQDYNIQQGEGGFLPREKNSQQDEERQLAEQGLAPSNGGKSRMPAEAESEIPLKADWKNFVPWFGPGKGRPLGELNVSELSVYANSQPDQTVEKQVQLWAAAKKGIAELSQSAS